MAFITIIVPVFNVEQYLERCISSLLSQKFKDFDIVLVDDGSSDRSGMICDLYSIKDSRIHVIHKKNGGLSDARNVGLEWALKYSDSKWITFVDSDDYVHKDYLNALYHGVISTGLYFSTCEYRCTQGEELLEEYKEFPVKVVSAEEYYCGKTNMFSAWSRLFHKSDFSLIRFPFGKICEDTFTTYKLMFKYDKIAVIDLPLYAYFQRSNSIMREQWNPKKLDVFEGYNLQIQFFKKNEYKFALKEVSLMYVYGLYEQIQECKCIPEYEATYLKRMVAMLRKHLWKYKSINGLSVKSAPWYYELTNPFMMKIYWFIKAQKDKLTKK